LKAFLVVHIVVISPSTEIITFYFEGFCVNLLDHLPKEIPWTFNIDFFRRRRSHKKMVASSRKPKINPMQDPTIAVVRCCGLEESPFIVSLGVRVALALALVLILVLVLVVVELLDGVYDVTVTVLLAAVGRDRCTVTAVVPLIKVLALLLITTVVVTRAIEVVGGSNGSSDDGW